jgi:starch phosphorylase
MPENTSLSSQFTIIPHDEVPVHIKDKLPNWLIHFKGMKAADIHRGFLNNLEYYIAKDQYTMTPYDKFLSLSYTVRDRLIERWIITQQQYHSDNVKRVYYLSLEFLMGRLLGNNIFNLGLEKPSKAAVENLGFDLEEIMDQEFDAGLGNGGLGRLAACFLDSMATMELPATGYGIRYEFGIFHQKIINGYQKEVPELWLENDNPWEIERPEYKVEVQYHGRVVYDHGNIQKARWVDTQDVVAIPFDTPIPGFNNNTVNTLRLWSARAKAEINLDQFQAGDYINACQDKINSENISKVLYPNDNNYSGKELRLKQQHFFTSASLQDILRRYLKHNPDLTQFAKKNAIQLNDTHPAISIVELMRLLMDEHGLDWDTAWSIVTETFAYTNHTLMPEALEKWPVGLMKNLLPRHMDIIYEINSRFLCAVGQKYPGDGDRIRRLSLIEEGHEQQVRMAYLAIVGSHSVNGVAALHTQLLERGLFRDFYELWPEKFNNKTNGITQRRWLYKCNEALSGLVTKRLNSSAWVKNLFELKKIEKHANDAVFQEQFRNVKYENKKRLAEVLAKWEGIQINVDSLFDVQVKRIHEYKRQLLNLMHVIHLYNELKAGRKQGFVPRTVFFGGKAAPGYWMAKQIIKLINNVGQVINNDPDTRDLLQVHFLPNYRVTMAEYLIPAADLSEQISTAGTEASGTGNMKFALNGALTIGTMDGANIEIAEAVGEENIFIFGLRTNEVDQKRAHGYNPNEYYHRSENLRRVIDLIRSDYFSREERGIFKPIVDSLLNGDHYMLFADFDAYVACQQAVSEAYSDQTRWTKMAIANVANMGKFSSDRTIQQYTEEIWNVKPLKIRLEK